MRVLGIESSHDDTSIAIVDDLKVNKLLKISQINIHKKYGGTVPEIASREHFQNFYVLLEELKKEIDLNSIDQIAYTKEPGLIGALQMGQIFAHALSKVLNKPLIGINHLEGHIYSVLLDSKNKIIYPCLALVVSGGHTNLYWLKNQNEQQLIGQTIDDALGEVFDKVARVLFNEFPGGPYIDQLFEKNKKKIKNQFHFSKPILKNKYDFSFSGYKTQIMNLVKQNKELDKELLAYCFQKEIINFVIKKIELAIKEFKPKSIILSGGVSANNYLREQFKSLHKNVLMPEIKYATDNGAMIAAVVLVKNKK